MNINRYIIYIFTADVKEDVPHIIEKFTIFLCIFTNRGDRHQSAHFDRGDILDLIEQFGQCLGQNAGLVLLPADIDLEQDIGGDVLLYGTAGDLTGELDGIDALDQIDLADDLAHLVGLQMTDELQGGVVEVVVLVL